ncbi:MAG: GH3 auxin-responsive promoter, partial [Rhodothermales bacterium]|nr:GH3 auxin-responsive promoter [Rhodothermales bacterium]
MGILDKPIVPSVLTPLGGIREFRADPVGTQARLLKDLLTRAADTEWGIRYGFGELAALDDPRSAYLARVPEHNYDDYREDVERVRRGEADIFWPGTFEHFAVSSGTASAGKIIPLSTEMLVRNRSFSLGAALSYFDATTDPAFFFGKLLSIPGRIEEDPKHPGTLIGEVSGLQYLFAPWALKKFIQAVPEEILFMPNWESKLDAIVEHTVEMDVRAIAMVPSWAIVLFRKLIRTYNARRGTNVTSVREIWPNLQVFFSGGVALASYRALLEQQIGGGRMDFVENYGASEGFISFQDRPNTDDMLVHLDNGVFLEFVEEGGTSTERISIEDVRTDVRYRILVTTCSGLWSYDVGDIVRFTSTDPYRLVVAGRTSEMLDRYGEAVYGDEAREALRKASDETNARFREFHVAPIEATSDS